MSYNEYLRNKKKSLQQIISPTRINTSGLQTQIQRYKSAVPQGRVESAGISLEHSSGSNVLSAKANAAVCCGPAQQTVTQTGVCIPRSRPYPWNGYAAKRPDPPAINYPPLGGGVCHCP